MEGPVSVKWAYLGRLVSKKLTFMLYIGVFKGAGSDNAGIRPPKSHFVTLLGPQDPFWAILWPQKRREEGPVSVKWAIYVYSAWAMSARMPPGWEAAGGGGLACPRAGKVSGISRSPPGGGGQVAGGPQERYAPGGGGTG